MPVWGPTIIWPDSPRPKLHRYLPDPAVVDLFLRGDIAGLGRLAEAADYVTAKDALYFLAEIGDPGDTWLAETVLTCLGDKYWAVRVAARWACGRLRLAAAVPRLAAMLDPPNLFPSKDWESEAADAALALGDIGGPAVVEPLLQALLADSELTGDAGFKLSDAAGQTFAHLGNSAALHILNLLTESDPRAVRAVAAHDALGCLDPCGDDGDLHGATAALVRYLREPPETSPGLVAADRQVKRDRLTQGARQAVILALARIGADSLPFLDLRRELRNTRRPELAAAAAKVMSRAESGRSALLDELTGHGHPKVLSAVCRALGEAGAGWTGPAIQDRLRDDRSASVRRAAASALAALDDTDAVGALLAALADPEIAETAAESVATLTPPPRDELLALLEVATGSQLLAVIRALTLLDERRAAGWLATALPAAPPELYDAIVVAAGVLACTEAASLLAAVVNDLDSGGGTRARAVRALGLIGEDAWTGLILARLGDPSEAVRIASCAALGSLNATEAAPTLTNLARQDASREVRLEAVRALGKLGPAGESQLIILLDLAERDVMDAAAIELAGLPSERSSEALLRLIRTQPGPWQSLIEALNVTGSPLAIRPLEVLLRSGYTNQKAAIRALTRIDDDRAESALLAAYRDGSTADKQAIMTIARRRTARQLDEA